jgi:hypothetical protein
MGSCPSINVADVSQPLSPKMHLTASELYDFRCRLNEAMRQHEIDEDLASQSDTTRCSNADGSQNLI